MSAVKIRRYIDVDAENIGERIKLARKADRRSVEVLASLAGITRAYWHDIEAERIRESLPETTLRKIEHVLGVNFGVNFDD